METKKAKLEKAEFGREWTGPKGQIYYFNLTWDNGDFGEMSTNRIKDKNGEKTQTKFTVGAEQEYTVQMKTNKKTGSEYMFFDKPKQPYNPGAYAGKKNDPDREGRIARSVGLQAAIHLVKKCDWGLSSIALSKKFVEWIEIKAQDEARSISAQAALNRAVLTIQELSEAERKEYNIEGFLKIADRYYDYIYGK